jgi:ADP-L-glycero-D-manno-heptose 6-epimerase
MRILVTGAAGFVGASLCKELEKLNHEVIGCDDLSSGSRKTLEGFSGELLVRSIGSLSAEDIKKTDAVFHQAAITDPASKDEAGIMRHNLVESLKLMKICSQHCVPFIYASSSAAYGNTKLPNKEFEAEKPHNSYALSKLLLDCAAVRLMGETQVIGLRYFNIYGPGEEFKGKTASIVRQFTTELLNNRRPIIYGDGTQKRDFVYIKDIVRSNLLAMKSKKSGVVNVGSGQSIKFNHLVSMIAEIVGKDLCPVYRENPFSESYQHSTHSDLRLAKKLIGFVPVWSVEKGLKEYVFAMAESAHQQA